MKAVLPDWPEFTVPPESTKDKKLLLLLTFTCLIPNLRVFWLKLSVSGEDGSEAQYVRCRQPNHTRRHGQMRVLSYPGYTWLGVSDICNSACAKGT